VEPLLLSIEEAAGLIRVSPRKFHDLIRIGEIRPVQVTPDLPRITLSELKAYVERLRRQGGAA